MKSEYRPRIVDSELDKRLKSIGAVVIEGAKWCGKSTTAEHHCKSAIFMDDPRRRSQYVIFAEDNPDMIMDGETTARNLFLRLPQKAPRPSSQRATSWRCYTAS